MGVCDRGFESSEKRGLRREDPGKEKAECNAAWLQHCEQSGRTFDFISKK